MELLDGESLRERMKREKQMDAKEAVRIAIELLEALSAAHAAGVIHRDVKPPNVFLTKPNGRVKLLDFGIAKVRAEFGKVHTTTGTVLGTPSYFAPEQLLAKEIDGRTDVHAVGIVLYEMLTGRRPWIEENPVDLTAAILHAGAPPIEKLRSDLPKELAAAVHSALEKDRFSRPTADELARRLAPFGPRKRTLAPFVFVALVGAAAAGGVAFMTTEETPTTVRAPAKPAASAAPVAEASVQPSTGPSTEVSDAAALIAEARDASANGYITRARALLKEAVKDGKADPETVESLAELCDRADDDECRAMIATKYPQRARDRDGSAER
jgi:serine/threonine-protein kinase